jgi:hypothetical protein
MQGASTRWRFDVEQRTILLTAEDVGVAGAATRHPAVDCELDCQCRVELDVVGDFRRNDPEDPADGRARQDATHAHPVIRGAVRELSRGPTPFNSVLITELTDLDVREVDPPTTLSDAPMKRPVCHSRVKEMSESNKKGHTPSLRSHCAKYTRARVTNGSFRDPELSDSGWLHRRHDNPALPILSQKALFCRCSVATCWR